MKNLIAIILSLFIVLPAFATGISTASLSESGFDKLSESQKAQLVGQVADLNKKNQDAQNSQAEGLNQDKVNQWVNLGTNLGKALAGAAKEANVAVNDFAKSPVGLLTTTLIVWHFIGSTLVHIFGGLVVLTVGLFGVRAINKRMVKEYTTTAKDGAVTVTKEDLSADEIACLVIMYVVTIIGALITVFTY